MTRSKAVRMRYSTTWMDIRVPETATVLEYGSDAFPEIAIHPHPEKAVREALQNPIAAPPLSELVASGDHVVIAFDDSFKTTDANRYVIPIVIEALTQAGVREEEIELVAAVGGHRKCMPLELRDKLLGPELYRRFCPFDGGASRIRNMTVPRGTSTSG